MEKRNLNCILRNILINIKWNSQLKNLPLKKLIPINFPAKRKTNLWSEVFIILAIHASWTQSFNALLQVLFLISFWRIFRLSRKNNLLGMDWGNWLRIFWLILSHLPPNLKRLLMFICLFSVDMISMMLNSFWTYYLIKFLRS